MGVNMLILFFECEKVFFGIFYSIKNDQGRIIRRIRPRIKQSAVVITSLYFKKKKKSCCFILEATVNIIRGERGTLNFYENMELKD